MTGVTVVAPRRETTGAVQTVPTCSWQGGVTCGRKSPYVPQQRSLRPEGCFMAPRQCWRERFARTP